MKYDLKKDGKPELNKTRRPALLTVPSHSYLAIVGTGDPNTVNFGDHIAALYAIAYPIKMAYKQMSPHDSHYTDYVVPPLCGDWSISEAAINRGNWAKTDFVYTLRIMIPDFVPLALAKTILATKQQQTEDNLVRKVTIISLPAQEVVQMLHVGPYEEEQRTFDYLTMFLEDQQLQRTSKAHTEIYLSDARRTAPDRLKTILQINVAPK
ncbi:GyrI-like domain-containing protein [Weissella sp. MSCH1]|uniref:GyrI-like domain-containing protein n=1 Tax=Weissella sp. MSCH1 TaxID=3383343 RepID=UPI0038969014